MEVHILERRPNLEAAAKAFHFPEQQHHTPEQADDRQLLENDHGDVTERVGSHAYFFRS
jgi:hypothetical protein